MVAHRIAGREVVHWVAEMVAAGGHLVGNSEEECKMTLPHGDPMKMVFEVVKD